MGVRNVPPRTSCGTPCEVTMKKPTRSQALFVCRDSRQGAVDPTSWLAAGSAFERAHTQCTGGTHCLIAAATAALPTPPPSRSGVRSMIGTASSSSAPSCWMAGAAAVVAISFVGHRTKYSSSARTHTGEKIAKG